MWPFAKPSSADEPEEPTRPTRSNLNLQTTPLQSLLEAPPGIRRRHARTPSPTNLNNENFTYPSVMPHTEGSDSADNVVILASGERIDVELLRQQAAAAAHQAAQASAALEAATAALSISRKKKPELPDFDHKNIEIWIRRVEAAYIRANISSASDKFAFLESKIAVNFNPTIDEFLYGDATDARWEEFLEYLKDEYSLSKQQKAAAFLDGIKRDGRRPSQHLARINQLTKDVTLDDLRKECILRGLPAEILRVIAPKAKTLTAAETAKMADDYFDKEGKSLHNSSIPTVSQVTQPQQTPETPSHEREEEDETINAVGGQSRFTPAFPNSQRQSRPAGRPYSNFRSKSRNNNGNGNANRGQSNNRSSNNPSNASNFRGGNNGMCFYHSSFGAKARKCEDPCNWKPQPTAQGNGNAGRRM